jgi:hypothetical protein
MAFSAVTERGSAADRTSDTSIAVSPSANLTVGKIVFVLVVTDNAQTTDGTSTNHDTLADTDTNTWNKVYERTAGGGAANAGVTASLWWTKVATQIDTTDSITFTGDTSWTSKLLMVWEATVGAGNTISLAGSTFAEGATNDPGGLTLSGLTSKEYLFLGIIGREEEIVTWTEDADYTNVFAAEGITTGPTGGAVTNVTGNVGYRILTGTGDTFDIAVGGIATQDWTEAFLAFQEVAGAVNLTGVSTIVLNSTGEGDQIQKLQAVSTVVLNSTGQARQVHTLDAISTVVLNSTGEADQIQKLASASTVVLNSTGVLTTAAFANLFGNSTIVLNSTGQARQTHTLDGISTVVLNSVSDLDLIYQLQTSPTIVINSNLDLDLVRRLLASSTIVVNSALDLELVARLLSTGTIVLNSTGVLTASAGVPATRGYVRLVETLNGTVTTTQTKIGTVTPSETLVGASSISES